MTGLFLRVSVLFLALAGIAVGIAAFKSDMVRIAFKKQPFDTLETAGTLRDPQTRRIIFARLEKKGDVDYYTFTAVRGTPIRLSLRTPVADRAFNPSLILFGPGLPKPTTDPGIGIGDVNGALVGRTVRDARTAVFMPASLTTYYLGPDIETTIPQDGTYAVAVMDSELGIGRYVLDVGDVPERSFPVFTSFAAGTIRAILRLY